MRLGLGNMLVKGGGSLNADGLSLDLQFATDKTLTARKGPTPVFTRSSGDNRGTTYFGPSSINAIFTFDGIGFNGDLSQTTLLNGRYRWENGDTMLSYNGTAWSLSQDGNAVATSALTSAFRPDGAVWSGTAAVVTATSTLGIVRAANNEPRFDHDPVTLACKGLLIEESRTNAILRSQDFSNVAWTKSNSTISGTLYTDPSGTSTANELVEDILLAAHTCQQSAGTATIGTTYTFSVFVKRKDTSNQFLLIGATGLVSASFISVNLTNGVTATGIGSPAAPINVGSTTYPNGWYRVQFSVVATSAAAITLDIRLSRDGTWANRSYLGDGVQSSLIWGAQVEAGSFPTSYIPTTTAALARSADVCSITGSDFTGMYNATEGSTYVQSIPAVINGTATALSLSNGSANERWLTRFFTAEQAVINSAGTESALDALNPVAGTSYRIATAAKLNDFAMSINGLAVVTDASQPMPVVNRLGIGTSLGSSGAVGGTVTIASIRYYKKRLANAKLQTLTRFVPDADANAYIVSLLAAGATVTAPQQAAIFTFISGEKTAGRWDGIKRLYLPIWGLAAANAICMKSLTSGTFTGAFLHTSRGAKSNASSGSYFQTAGQLPALGISKSSYHISYMVTDNMGDNYADNGFLMQGVNTSPAVDVECRNTSASNDDNIIEYVGVSLSVASSTANIICSNFGVVTEPMGIISCNGNGSAQYIKHRNVLGVSTKSTNSISQSGELSGGSLTFMGSQYSETVAPVTCGLLTLGTHMTSEQDSLFTAALKALWENVTGQSLPTL